MGHDGVLVTWWNFNGAMHRLTATKLPYGLLCHCFVRNFCQQTHVE